MLCWFFFDIKTVAFEHGFAASVILSINNELPIVFVMSCKKMTRDSETWEWLYVDFVSEAYGEIGCLLIQANFYIVEQQLSILL